MSNINTGGPAFPRTGRANSVGLVAEDPQKGMTLRDYFAAKALPAMLEVCSTNQRAAEEAYAVADAMLKARES